MKKLVIIESPFGTRPDGSRCSAEEMAENQRYLDACIRDSLNREEQPFASHGFYPRVLNDATPAERKLGMEAGFAWGTAAARAACLCEMASDEAHPPELTAAVAVYTDLGVTSGMQDGITRHKGNGLKVELRLLGGEWKTIAERRSIGANERSLGEG